MNAGDQPIQIMLVDDCQAGSDVVRRALMADARFTVPDVATLEDLHDRVRERSPDVIVSELGVGGSADLEIVEKVRAIDRAIPLIILTSRGSERIAVAAMKLGAADYLTRCSDDVASLPERIVVAISAHRDLIELKHAEQQRDQIFSQSLSLICIVGFDGLIKRANPSWESILGYSCDEIRSMPISQFMHPADVARLAAAFRELRQGAAIQGIQGRVRSEDGSHRWMLWDAVSCAEQKVLVCTGQDITARKETEEQLLESQERFQLIARATNEAVWDWDLRADRLWQNEVYLHAYGEQCEFGKDAIETWRGRLHPDDHDRVLSELPTPLKSGHRKWALKYRLRRQDGTYAHVFDRGFTIFNDENEPVRMAGSLMDVSELTETEEKLRESEERFRLAVRATRDAVWDWDLRKGHVWRSEGFFTLFGYRPDEITPDPNWWIERIHPDDRVRHFSTMPAIDSVDRPERDFEYRFRRADGSYADVLERGFVMRSPDGTPLRMIGTMMDISGRRRAEELAHIQRAELAHIARVSTMGEIATGLAHELNQPLTAIANYAESCAQAIGGGSPDRDAKLLPWIERIAANTHRAAEMIRRLRGFTRKSEPRRSTVEINELVQEVLDLLEAETRLQGVRVHWKPTGQAFAALDRVQIQQVLVNLLRNAYEAMSPYPQDERQVIITAAWRENKAEISVEDRGEGIAPENRDRVFDAFFTSKANGVGIGLAISRSIVEDHGGRLWLSANARQGVTFTFTLPILGAPDARCADGVCR